MPVDRQGAQLLFRIIADSYERRSMVLTTNLEFSKWGTIFTDDQMAAAMIDRLAHHGHILLFEGESYRMKHALMRQRGEEKFPISSWVIFADFFGDFYLTKYTLEKWTMWMNRLSPMENKHNWIMAKSSLRILL